MADDTDTIRAASVGLTQQLAWIAQDTDTIAEAERTRALAVAQARISGASWADIGAAARMTRQAAQQRWGVRPSTIDADPMF